MQKISTLVGVIIIVVAAVILFGGVFAYQYLIIKLQQNSEFFGSSQKTPQTLVQTSDWKTYTNTQYGFEFKYPQDITINENDMGSGSTSFQVGQNLRININPKPSTYTNLLDRVKNIVEQANIPSAQGAMPSETKYYQKSIEGLDAYLIETKAADAPINTFDRVELSNKNYLIEFAYNYQGWILLNNPESILGGGPVPQNFKKELTDAQARYNQIQLIISTLKFISQTSTQPSITVTSPKGGETFKAGQNMNITWKSSGLGDSCKIDIGLMDYTNPADITNLAYANNLPCDSTSYNWTIPVNNVVGDKIIGSKYKIEVGAWSSKNIPGNSMIAFGENYFSIVAP